MRACRRKHVTDCPKHEETNAEEWEAVLANCLQYDLWGKTARPTRIWLANTFDRIPARPLSLTIAPQSLGGELQREAGILQGLSADGEFSPCDSATLSAPLLQHCEASDLEQEPDQRLRVHNIRCSPYLGRDLLALADKGMHNNGSLSGHAYHIPGPAT